MKKIKFSILIIVFILSTGCWNYQELNDLAIATVIAVDKTDDDLYEVSILVSNDKNTQVSSKEGESLTTVYSGTGRTISEALKDIDLKIPRQIYLGHLAVVIIDDDVAKDGILNVSDALLRNPETVKRFLLILARGDKAKDIIKVLSPLESFPSQNIYANIKTSNESQAISTSITYSEFIENTLKKGINPILPSTSVKGDIKDGSKIDSLQKSEPDAHLKLRTDAIFKKDKFVGYTSADESKGINIIRNRINQMNITTSCSNEDNYIVSKLLDLKSNFEIKLEDDIPIGTITVKSSGEIIELNCNLDLSDDKVIQEIEKETEKAVKELIMDALSVTQEKYKSDVFGFGTLLYKKYPKLYNEIDDWDEYFSTLEIRIKVDLKLELKGSLQQSLEALNEK